MTVEEIRNLEHLEFAERYPFFINPDYDEDGDEDCDEMVFYKNDGRGWNPLVLCWAEKVRDIVPEGFFVIEAIDEDGEFILNYNYEFKTPELEKYTKMARHLAKYTCYECGKISSDLKIYASDDGCANICEECARDDVACILSLNGITDDSLIEEDFKRCYKPINGSWIVDGLDCHELFEGIYNFQENV